MKSFCAVRDRAAKEGNLMVSEKKTKIMVMNSEETYIHTYIHTSPASPERLALSLEHVDHDDLVDVDARVRVELGHVRACVSSLSS